MLKIAIYGSALGGGAAQIIEALSSQDKIKPVLILDRDTSAIGKDVFGVPVVGSTEELKERWMRRQFDEVAIAIGGDLVERKRVYEFIVSLNIPLANVIGKEVLFGLNTSLGKGNVILNHSYIGNNSSLGNNNYILNQCSVQHDTVIGDHNYLATNVTIGAKVRIGSQNRLGIKCIVETKAIIEDGYTFKAAEIINHNH